MALRQKQLRTAALSAAILVPLSVLSGSCALRDALPEFAGASPEVAKLRVYVESPKVTYADNDCPTAGYLGEGFPGEFRNAVEKELVRASIAIVDQAESSDVIVTPNATVSRCAGGRVYGGGGLTATADGAAVGKSEVPSAWSKGALGGAQSVPTYAEFPEMLAAYIVRPLVTSQQLQKYASAGRPTSPVIGIPAKNETAAVGTAERTTRYVAGTPQRANYAVIVGIEDYRHVPKVPGAGSDAQRFASMAQATLGIPLSNIHIILNEAATKSDIEMQLDWLKASVTSGGRAYFFFSGHGAPEPSSGTSYLLPQNGNPTNLARSAIKLDDVMRELNATKAKEVVVFLDSCFSGAGGRSVLPPGARPLVRVQTPPSKPKVAVFASSTGSEISGGATSVEGGLFSHYVTEGLGKGDADMDGDGQITLKELADWVTPRVKRQAKQEQNRDQTPVLLLGDGVGSPDTVSLAWGIAK